jgi:3-methyl-2-oxobutanoate hydroxymethyltransferase
LAIPTVGIGAGPDCDGQVLVSYDAFGLFDRFVPPFVKQYAHLGQTMVQAAQAYIEDVQAGSFPGEEHSTRTAVAVKERA